MCKWGDTVLIDSGQKMIGVDRCIAQVVEALLEADIQTVASCCGHGNRPGRISLIDGRELIIVKDAAEAEHVCRGYPDIHGSPRIVSQPEPGKTRDEDLARATKWLADNGVEPAGLAIKQSLAKEFFAVLAYWREEAIVQGEQFTDLLRDYERALAECDKLRASVEAVSENAVLFVARAVTGDFSHGHMDQRAADEIMAEVRRHLVAYHDYLASAPKAAASPTIEGTRT